MHGDEKIVRICMDSIDMVDADEIIDPFERSTDETIWLEVHKGEIILAAEKVRRSLDEEQCYVNHNILTSQILASY